MRQACVCAVCVFSPAPPQSSGRQREDLEPDTGDWAQDNSWRLVSGLS